MDHSRVNVESMNMLSYQCAVLLFFVCLFLEALNN